MIEICWFDNSDTLYQNFFFVSDLSNLARKLKKEKRERFAAGERHYAQKQRADRALFRTASPFVKRVLREMANGCYGRILWLIPLYGIRTISNQSSLHRGWHLFIWGAYKFPGERNPRHADLSVKLSEHSLTVWKQHQIVTSSGVSENEFRDALKKALPKIM